MKDGLSIYGYCGNNPLKYRDPNGLSREPDDKAGPPPGIKLFNFFKNLFAKKDKNNDSSTNTTKNNKSFDNNKDNNEYNDSLSYSLALLGLGAGTVKESSKILLDKGYTSFFTNWKPYGPNFYGNQYIKPIFKLSKTYNVGTFFSFAISGLSIYYDISQYRAGNISFYQMGFSVIDTGLGTFYYPYALASMEVKLILFFYMPMVENFQEGSLQIDRKMNEMFHNGAEEEEIWEYFESFF